MKTWRKAGTPARASTGWSEAGDVDGGAAGATDEDGEDGDDVGAEVWTDVAVVAVDAAEQPAKAPASSTLHTVCNAPRRATHCGRT
jgi:hypothetical protein